MFVLLEALFGFTQRGEEKIEPLAVIGTGLAVERFNLPDRFIQDALTITNALQLALFLGRCAGDKQPAKGLRRVLLGRDPHAGAVP